MRFLLVPFAAVACVACTSIESEDIETDGINPNINLTSQEGASTTRVGVALHVGNNLTNFVDLGEGDTLTASQGDETITLDESSVLGLVSYSGTLSTDVPGTEVTVAFERIEHDPAPASKVTLTERLALTAPAGAATFSRANDDLQVQWTSAESDDQVRVAWSGTCVRDDSRDVTAGALELTIEAGSIEKKPDPEEGEPVPENCEVTLTVSRSRAGSLDPAWGGGSITHTYSDSVTFTSNP